MPTEFTRAQVEAVGALARLELDASEVELFTRQLGDILAHADHVQRIDTTGVPPTTSPVAGRGVERQDEVVPSLDLADVLSNAPAAQPGTGLFRVPRVIG